MVRHNEQNDIPLIWCNDSYEFVSNVISNMLLRHMQEENMYHRSSHFAYIKKIRSRIREVLFYCGRCAQTRELRGKYGKAPIPEPVRPYGVSERWHVDVWGPCKEDKTKFFVVGTIDAFSKYVVAEMYHNKSANTCHNFIMNELCLKFGVLKHISMD